MIQTEHLGGTRADAYGAYSDAAVSAFLPSALGSYNHGIPVPVPKDPWHDEGGESGSTP